MSYDDVKGAFQKGGASMRCSEVVRCLEDLGFVVEPGNKGNHKKFKHPAIPTFYGSNFDCGHGKNPKVLSCYIRNILRTMNELEEEIKNHLGE